MANTPQIRYRSGLRLATLSILKVAKVANKVAQGGQATHRCPQKERSPLFRRGRDGLRPRARTSSRLLGGSIHLVSPRSLGTLAHGPRSVRLYSERLQA